MQVLTHIDEVRGAVAGARSAGKSVGVVPTMGALHVGHGRLIETARAECDFVIVTIFVNQLQFGPNEDFTRYPRDLEKDAAFCAERGGDIVFAPSPQEMYPDKQLTFVEVAELTKGLCGASRPGHFRGVTTVVSKLFNIVGADKAFFGQKDAQQVAVIQRMVRDLNFPIEIRVVPTVREADGLAMSSRNAYLSPVERGAALVLHRALHSGARLVENGEKDPAKVREHLVDIVKSEPLARLDYAEVVDADTLEEIDCIDGRVLMALAVFVGKTRLIDNVITAVN